MLIPISDDNPRYTRPYVNYALLGINILVHVLVFMGGHPEQVWQEYGMKPSRFMHAPLTLLTSMFLHGDIFHLGGNMLFLWIVGDNVEDALGHIWYLVMYLAGGIAADLIHAASAVGSDVPTIGASGAISAVLGFYMVVFPKNRIRIFYWFFWIFIGTFWASAMWVIGAWFVMQVLLGLVTPQIGGGGVAHWAHIGGFVFGALLAGGLRVIMPNINPHRRHGGRVAPESRPRPFRAARPSPFGVASPTDDIAISLGPRRSVDAAPAGVAIDLHGSPDEMEAAIGRRLANGDALGAHRLFASLARGFPGRAIAPTVQLKLVQALEGMHRHDEAAGCLEHFLATHPDDANASEAALALGMIYGRHLHRADRARVLLARAAREHPNPARATLAREELAGLP